MVMLLIGALLGVTVFAGVQTWLKFVARWRARHSVTEQCCRCGITIVGRRIHKHVTLFDDDQDLGIGGRTAVIAYTCPGCCPGGCRNPRCKRASLIR